MQIIYGVILFFSGIFFASHKIRPWIDWDFAFTWYGVLLLLDWIAKKRGKYSLFSSSQLIIILACVSAVFWWFYEWINLSTKNWAYPQQILYTPLSFGFVATIGFTTVLPFLILMSFIVSTFFTKKIYFLKSKLNSLMTTISIILGLLSLFICFVFPLYGWTLTWFIVFFIFDALNAHAGRRSLLVQFINKNYMPLLFLSITALPAGVIWESLNYFVPKWTYPLVPWFWALPAPLTTKFVEMPLIGFLGYIPFIWSAFAFVEFLQLDVCWFAKEK